MQNYFVDMLQNQKILTLDDVVLLAENEGENFASCLNPQWEILLS